MNIYATIVAVFKRQIAIAVLAVVSICVAILGVGVAVVLMKICKEIFLFAVFFSMVKVMCDKPWHFNKLFCKSIIACNLKKQKDGNQFFHAVNIQKRSISLTRCRSAVYNAPAFMVF